MPTLLSVNNYYYRRGGADALCLDHNRLIEQHGWGVVPFAMQHPLNLPTQWSCYFIDEIEFGRAYSLGQKVRAVHNVVYSRDARRKLTGLLATIKPDICHAHNIYHHLSPSILSLLKARSIPVIMTLHDLKLACPAYSMLTHDGICERCKSGRLSNVIKHKCIKDSWALSTLVFIESRLHRMLKSYLRNVDRFIVPSRFYIDKFAEWGFDRDRFEYIPNFIDIDPLTPRTNPGRAFLYFGRLAPEKGVVTLLKAAKLAKVSLWIAGTGALDTELRRFASDQGVDVTFLGYLQGDALHEAIRAARATVLPSQWYENAPISVLESHALGVPVIGAHIGGIPELIHHGETGWTFTSGSEKELAEVLRKVGEMSDSELTRLGQQGRATVEAQYTADIYRERVLDLYARLGVAT